MSSEDKDLIDLDTTPDPSQRKRAWSGFFKGIFDDEEDKRAASTSPTPTPTPAADAANPPASGFDRNWRFPSPARADNTTSPAAMTASAPAADAAPGNPLDHESRRAASAPAAVGQSGGTGGSGDGKGGDDEKEAASGVSQGPSGGSG